MEPTLNHDLALRYAPLALSMARRTKSLDFEDAAQDAMVGLLVAARRYDPERGAAFPTYARYWITEALQTSAIRSSPVHVPLHAAKASHAARTGRAQGPAAMKSLAAASLAGGTLVVAIPLEYEDGESIAGLPVHDDRESLDRHVDAHRIIELFSRLSARQREALSGYYLDDGATLETVASTMGISKEAVRQAIQRGIARLRELLDVGVNS